MQTRHLNYEGSNLSAFADPYNDHCYTVHVKRGGCHYTLARTKCTSEREVERFVAENLEQLRAAAARYGACITRAEEVAAETARFEHRIAAAEEGRTANEAT